MEQSERENILNYLKSCITDAAIYAIAQDEETFSDIYDKIIHGELAKKLHIQDIRELHLTYLMLVNTFNKNGLIALH